MSRSNVASSRPPPISAGARVDDGARIKGTALRSTLGAIEKLHGAGGLRAVRDALDPSSREPLDRVLLVGWYPVSLSASLHDAVRRALGFGSWDVSRALGREAARIDCNGVYRVVLREVQYDTVFSRLELTWRHYYSQGAFRWDHRRPGFTRLTISEVCGFNEGMWLACAGRAEELLRLTGARAAEVSVREVYDRACTFEGAWRA